MLHHTALATACLESWHHCPGLATHYTLHHADTISRGQSSYKTPHWVSWHTHCFTDLTRNHIQDSDRGFWTPIKSPEASLTDKLIYWTSALILWHTVNIWNYWHRQIRGQCGYWSYTGRIHVSIEFWTKQNVGVPQSVPVAGFTFQSCLQRCATLVLMCVEGCRGPLQNLKRRFHWSLVPVADFAVCNRVCNLYTLM